MKGNIPAASEQLAILLDNSSLVLAAAATRPRRCNPNHITAQHGRSCQVGDIDECRREFIDTVDTLTETTGQLHKWMTLPMVELMTGAFGDW